MTEPSTTEPSTTEQCTLYYDGQCPLCAAEVERLATLKDGQLQLADVHSLQLDEHEKAEKLLNLHYETPDGQMLIGLDANVAAWQHTRWGWLFRWLRWPLIRPVADAVYRYWAKIRYQRLYS